MLYEYTNLKGFHQEHTRSISMMVRIRGLIVLLSPSYMKVCVCLKISDIDLHFIVWLERDAIGRWKMHFCCGCTYEHHLKFQKKKLYKAHNPNSIRLVRRILKHRNRTPQLQNFIS